MVLFKRLSDSFWSYVSPQKSNATQATPKTVPTHFKRPAIPLQRRGSMREAITRSRSMSPTVRIDNWKLGSSSSQSSSESVVGSRKRKRPLTPSTSAGRRRRSLRKTVKREEEMDDTPELDYEDDTLMDDDADEDEEDLSSGMSNIRVARSPSDYGDFEDDDDDDDDDGDHVDVDSTLVVSEAEYNRASSNRNKIIPHEHSRRGVSPEELRAAGWDDDHITLVQKTVMRGFEPLLPQHWQFDYRFLPDALFSPDDHAFISSVRKDHYRGILALEKLFELGGRTRDRVLLNGAVTPEEQVRRSLREYMRWADEDAGLDARTAIPILVFETKPANTPAPVLQENARRKLARLAARYKEAFGIKQSIETSPASSSRASTSTKLAYRVPRLYAIIASHTVVALVAYTPDDAEQQIKSVAFFDLKDKDYDVWNSLALAIVVCHARNVQMRIAGETGIGVKMPGMEGEEDDPDA